MTLGWRLSSAVGISLALHAALLGAAKLGGRATGDSVAPASGAIEVRLASPSAPAVAPRPEIAQASSPGGIPGPSKPRYFTSSEVDERATPIALAPLVYPEIAYMNRLPGTVRMRVFISEKGQVVRAEIVEATPPGHFEQAAAEAVRRTRFHPAQKNGRPVRSQKVIEIGFDPYGPRPGDPAVSPSS